MAGRRQPSPALASGAGLRGEHMDAGHPARTLGCSIGSTRITCRDHGARRATGTAGRVSGHEITVERSNSWSTPPSLDTHQRYLLNTSKMRELPDGTTRTTSAARGALLHRGARQVRSRHRRRVSSRGGDEHRALRGPACERSCRGMPRPRLRSRL